MLVKLNLLKPRTQIWTVNSVKILRYIFRWCSTCKGWKNQLLSRRRGTFSRWENTESWQWNVNFENIISVFLPIYWSPSHSNLFDFSTACHVWGNCKEFNLGKSMLSNVKSLRNKTVAHNPDLKVNENKKRKVFNVLKTLLHTNAVQAHIDLTTCMQELGEIEKGNYLTDILSTIPESTETYQQQHAGFHTRQEQLEKIIQFEESRRNGNIRQEAHGRSWTLLWITQVLVCFILMTTISNVDHPPYDGCISETYSHPFPQDLYLFPYVGEHGYLFGRQWLLKEIETNIFQSSSTNKGVLLTADMGGGKSAIVKHLLCSKENEKGNQLTRNIVAFHVCKFDVPTTKNAQRFVYRLVGFLSTSFPEFGELLISMIPRNAILYDHEKCRREIEACFDQGVGQPLRMLQHIPTSTKIVIIDALDECYEQHTNKNELSDLLKVRYRDFPKWLKFIVTSRNSSQYDALYMINLTRVHMNSVDKRNHNDIRVFYDFKANVYPHIKNASGGSNQFVRNSEGNFMHAVNSLELLLTCEYCNQPKSIDEIYELNFRRYFPSTSSFNTAGQILELVLASIHPLSKSEIATILSNNVSTENLSKSFDNLMFCLRTEKDVTFVHQSYQKWLVESANVQFHISIEKGHAAISRYFLTQVRGSKYDIIDIAIHVSMSKDTSLIKYFELITPSLNVTQSGLHRLIWRSNSVAALRLLLPLYQNIDTLNEGNVTAAFVAASNGNLDQLRLLRSNGANLNFIVNGSFTINSIKQISLIKNSLYFGYSLIHIATHNGHYATVEFLIQHNSSLIHVKNHLGLTASEMACENGRLAILKLLVEAGGHAGHCLYFAAKNGHVSIIEMLAHKGVNMSCLTARDSNKAVKKLFNVSIPTSVLQTNESLKKPTKWFNMYDIWWIVEQESPLHASIKAKLVDTSRVLINRYPHFTDCVNAFGMTPFLLSIVKNQTMISEMFPDKVFNDRCESQNISLLEVLSDMNLNDKLDCPLGAGYMHLIASHGEQCSFKAMLGKRIDSTRKWLMPDANLSTPVHYAACHGNIDFLNKFIQTNSYSFSNIRSKNGSTPCHSAVMCGSLLSFEAILVKSDDCLRIKDAFNRSVLHYVFMRDYSETIAQRSFNQQHETLQIIVYLLRSSHIDIEEKDAYKRNILHYALRNGHYVAVRYIYTQAYTKFIAMVKEKDMEGNTPVEYALKRNIDIERLGNNLLTTNCYLEGHYRQLFLKYKCISSWETASILILILMENEVDRYFLPNFKYILRSYYLTDAALEYIKEVDDRFIIRHLEEFITTLHEKPMLELALFSMAKYRPSVFIKCGKPLPDSPFHLLSYNGFLTANVSPTLLIHAIFGHPVNKSMLSCSDRKGYNAFHYSLFGGNVHIAKALFDEDIDMQNGKVAITEIPRIMLIGKKPNSVVSLSNIVPWNYYDQYLRSPLDILLHAFLKKYYNRFSYVDICNEATSNLSLVHLIAASGLNLSLNFLKHKFGDGTVKCSNRHRLTPTYLWSLLHERDSKEVLNETAVLFPYKQTEAILLIHLFSDFSYSYPNSPLACLLNNGANLKYELFQCLRYLRRRNVHRESFDTGNVSRIYLDAMAMYLYEYFNYRQGFHLRHLTKFRIPFGFVKASLHGFVFGWRENTIELKIPFNYPGLNNLNYHSVRYCISKQDKCPLNKYRVYKEVEHMLNRFFTHYKHLLFNLYRRILDHGTPLVENTFLKRRLDANRNLGLGLNYNNESKLFYHIVEHRYLKEIQRTTVYQYLKYSMNFPMNITELTELTRFLKTSFVSVKGTFDDIYNATSYFT